VTRYTTLQAALLCAVALLAAGLWLRPCSAGADTGEAALALQVARVGVHEGGFGSPGDIALVHQATLAHGDTAAERLRWLRRHSARVAGTRPARSLRTLWVRALDATPSRPEGFPVRWRPEVWESRLELARDLVSGRVVWRPCDGHPWTWGSRQDHRGAVRRGLVALACKGARNRGYALSR